MTGQVIPLTKPKNSRGPKVATIIQARMTSSRFPGKSMALLDGKPVLQWVIERCQHIKGPKGKYIGVIVAVPDTKESEPMLKLISDLQNDKVTLENYCGPEHNVLRRYYEAAVFFELDYIIRVTADCPFIDPTVCSEIVQLLFWRKLDYCSNVHPKRSYPKGLDCEAFTFDALEAAYKLADSPYDIEHVTPWMQRTPEVKKGNVVQKKDMSELNWCVDYPEDIARLEKDLKDSEEIIPLVGANENVIN